MGTVWQTQMATAVTRLRWRVVPMPTRNYNEDATDSDDSCDFSCYGCTISASCNYDPTATISNGSCDFASCVGCTNAAACNYDQRPPFQPTDCVTSLQAHLRLRWKLPERCRRRWRGDEQEIYGCTTPGVGYDPFATEDDGSCPVGGCIIPSPVFACNYDPDADYLIFSMCVNPPCTGGTMAGSPTQAV